MRAELFSSHKITNAGFDNNNDELFFAGIGYNRRYLYDFEKNLVNNLHQYPK